MTNPPLSQSAGKRHPAPRPMRFHNEIGSKTYASRRCGSVSYPACRIRHRSCIALNGLTKYGNSGTLSVEAGLFAASTQRDNEEERTHEIVDLSPIACCGGQGACASDEAAARGRPGIPSFAPRHCWREDRSGDATAR